MSQVGCKSSMNCRILRAVPKTIKKRQTSSLGIAAMRSEMFLKCRMMLSVMLGSATTECQLRLKPVFQASEA